MCGIVELVDLKARRDIDPTLLQRMTASRAQRGPDQQNTYCEAGASYGHRFRTRCDTEVIVHAWEQWCEHCVERFRGMFVFGLWEGHTQTVFLARDRFGGKSLHCAKLPDGFLAFGSELKALMVHPVLERQMAPAAVADSFAYGYVPEPRTNFQHALKLPPAHALCIRRGEAMLAPQPYWDIPFGPLPAMSEAQAGSELIEQLREAVRIGLVDDVPPAAFLRLVYFYLPYYLLASKAVVDRELATAPLKVPA